MHAHPVGGKPALAVGAGYSPVACGDDPDEAVFVFVVLLTFTPESLAGIDTIAVAAKPPRRTGCEIMRLCLEGGFLGVFAGCLRRPQGGLLLICPRVGLGH